MKLLANKKKIMAAVSGGPDSMCMLDLYKNKIALVCHVNYNKRETAIRDQLIVENYCSENNIPLEILNVGEEQYEAMKNFQSFGREIRYSFFKSMSEKYGLNEIYIAHNFNDFLETAYMQKIRSKNLLFYGIKQKSSYKGLKIFRPLLMLQRVWIERYCEENNIKFGIDESNNEPIYERNKVRMVISNWTKDSIYKFKQEILNHNWKNKKKLERIEKIFESFKENQFSINFIINQSDLFKYHLIYKYLSQFDINSTDSKIKSIIEFINLKSKKKYRLKEKIFLHIVNGKLEIIRE